MRFYVPNLDEKMPELTGEAHTHAAYAMRLRVGDEISIFNGNGVEYYCKVASIQKNKTTLDIIDSKINDTETKRSFALYLAVIKPDKFEFAVQKTTELGVKRITPVMSALSQRNTTLHIDRLQKIAISACEQCGRSMIPQIENCIEFTELPNRVKNDTFIFGWEKEKSKTISDIEHLNDNISLFIGPEGGITDDEANLLISVGATPVTLGKRILRAETAAISALAALCYATGEWQ